MGQTVILIPSMTSSGVGEGIPLATYRDLLADEIGFKLETTVTTSADGGEGRRIVLADDFRDDEAGSTLVPGGNAYLYVIDGAQAGSQSRIVSQADAGYQGVHGGVVLARPFGGRLAAGTSVLVTSPLPVKRYLTVKGLDDCINEALARVPAMATLTLTLTGAGTDTIPLADYPWIEHIDQILGQRDRYGTGDDPFWRSSALPSFINANNADRTLHLGRYYGVDETLELLITLPADRLIYNGLTWGYPDDPGLHTDIHRAAVPERWVLTYGMSRALRFLYRHVRDDRRIPREEKVDLLGDLMIERQKWAQACMVLREHEFPRARVVYGEGALVSGTTSGGGDGYPIESGAAWGWSW
jgi:hypothetical protein